MAYEYPRDSIRLLRTAVAQKDDRVAVGLALELLEGFLTDMQRIAVAVETIAKNTTPKYNPPKRGIAFERVRMTDDPAEQGD